MNCIDESSDRRRLSRLLSELSPSGIAITKRPSMNDASRIGKMFGCSRRCASRASRLKSARKKSVIALSCGTLSATLVPWIVSTAA